MITCLAFDADDTLWHNETLFAMTQEELYQRLRPYAEEEQLHHRLIETERRNLRLYGYGVKGFTLSMIETALEVTEGRVPSEEIRAILEAGKKLLSHPIELLPGVRETLLELNQHYNLMLITKGDLFHQESRIAASGLGEFFGSIEIVSEKDPATYQKLLTRYHLQAEHFVMVGNSLRSDILPVVEVGGRAVHIPYEVTWELEKADPAGLDPQRWRRCDRIDQLPGLLTEWLPTPA